MGGLSPVMKPVDKTRDALIEDKRVKRLKKNLSTVKEKNLFFSNFVDNDPAFYSHPFIPVSNLLSHTYTTKIGSQINHPNPFLFSFRTQKEKDRLYSFGNMLHHEIDYSCGVWKKNQGGIKERAAKEKRDEPSFKIK